MEEKKKYSSNKEYLRQYYQDHKEERYKKNKEMYQQNREKELEDNKRRRFSPASVSYLPKLEKYDECRVDPNNDKLLQVRCKNSKCNEWFNPTMQQVRARLSSIRGYQGGECNLYCSDECKNECPLYKKRKDFTKNNKSGDRRNSQKQLKNILISERGEVCERCGRSKIDFPDLNLICHHIIPHKCSPILSSDKDNCLIVCSECHEFLHNLPKCTLGYLANIPE